MPTQLTWVSVTRHCCLNTGTHCWSLHSTQHADGTSQDKQLQDITGQTATGHHNDRHNMVTGQATTATGHHNTTPYSYIIIIYPLTVKVIRAPQMISQQFPPFSPVLHCPLGPDELQACPFPDVVFPLLPLSASLLSLITVPCKMALPRPDEWETCSYHCSLHLFTMVRRSSCHPIACLILAQTLLVTWSLHEMYSLLG